MLVKTAEFVTSSVKINQCPTSDIPEICFIGRSNVGKSSLINMLTNYGKLAKVSSSPGKTKTINHFIINNQWYLVDLPGYGYAKDSKTEREKWRKFINSYLLNRENLYCTFVLLDSRHSPQKNDLEFINFLGQNQIPFSLIFTKKDKISSVELDKNISAFKKELKLTFEFLPEIFSSSSKDNQGKDSILNYIESFL